MNTRKYGYSKFHNPLHIRFAVMVYTVESFKFVTDIDTFSKTWKAFKDKEAHLFETREFAQDTALNLMMSGTPAWVVEVVETTIPRNL
jgi:hypothetical protein